MLKKPIAIPLLLIGVAAGFMATATDWHDFKQMTARTAVSEEISKPGTKCPLSKAYADSLDLEVLSICSAYGLIAMEAARRYPASAQNVFALYGEDPLFQAVFERYGQMVVPVVGYFVENGSNRYRANAVLQGAVARVSRGQTPTWGAPSGEQMGLMAIQELDERGSEVLAEFEVVDGRVRRKSIEATVLGTKNLILGGIHKLETVWTRGESPTWKDYGGAALDVALVAGGVGLLAKEARVAEAAAGRSSPRFVAANATKILRTIGTVAVGPIGNAAVLYVVLTHPTLIASAVGWAAEQVGLNGPLCIFFAYLLLFQFLYWFLRPMLWLLWQPIRAALWTYSRAVRNPRRFRPESAVSVDRTTRKPAQPRANSV
ncbi:hypothetical protein ACVWZV_000327 [Bradyrhizobium sp. GM5.1]